MSSMIRSFATPTTLKSKITKLQKPSITPPVIPGLKRVLQVGINYVNTPYELAGCINDITNMGALLRTYFPKCKEYKVLTDNATIKPTRANIIAAFDWLVSGLKSGENVIFQYSGHGGIIRDKNGDEVSGYDSCIYPVNETVLETITDDEIRSCLAARVPKGCKCFIILDACHSGTAVDLRYKWETSAAGTMTYTEDKKYTKLGGTVLFLSGCKDNQTAADTADENWRPCGALTWAILETWKKYGPAIKTKYILWDVRDFLKTKGYTQIPQLTSGNFLDINTVFDLSK